MSAHDERAPIDENVSLESRHLRGRPHVHGLMWSVAGQLPPWSPVAAPQSLSGDGVDCAGVEVGEWEVEEDAWGRMLALHEEQRILAHLPCRKLPRGDPWAVYSDAPVPDLDGEASTGGSE